MQLAILNFPEKYDLKVTKTSKNQFQVFDIIRKKNILLTPEEWVRQHFLQYLKSKDISDSQILVEKQLDLNGTQKRLDVLVMRKNSPYILIELKAPEIQLQPQHFEQIARYNAHWKAPNILISNGLQHIAFQQNENGNYNTLKNWEDLF